MRVKTKVFTSLLAVLLMVVMLQTGAAAAGMGFSASPVLPSNQRDTTTSYFDLLVQPGQQQDLTVTITNTSDEAIRVTVGAYTASTNRNGLVVYNDSEPILDDSMQYSFSDLARVQESMIELSAGESRNAVVSINVPNENFDGLILGGIEIVQELTEEELNSGAMIVNQYSSVIAVQLRTNETEIDPELELGTVQAELVNYRAAVIADIQNKTPVLIKEASATAQVLRGNSVVLEETNERVSIAPHTVYRFPLRDREGRGLQAGTYTAKVQVSHAGKTWDFEQEFTIEAEEAATINSESVNQNSQSRMAGTFAGLPMWAIIAMIAGVVIIIVVIILIIRMVKKNKAMTDDLLANLPPIPSIDDADAGAETTDSPKTED